MMVTTQQLIHGLNISAQLESLPPLCRSRHLEPHARPAPRLPMEVEHTGAAIRIGLRAAIPEPALDHLLVLLLLGGPDRRRLGFGRFRFRDPPRPALLGPDHQVVMLEGLFLALG